MVGQVGSIYKVEPVGFIQKTPVMLYAADGKASRTFANLSVAKKAVPW